MKTLFLDSSLCAVRDAIALSYKIANFFATILIIIIEIFIINLTLRRYIFHVTKHFFILQDHAREIIDISLLLFLNSTAQRTQVVIFKKILAILVVIYIATHNLKNNIRDLFTYRKLSLPIHADVNIPARFTL